MRGDTRSVSADFLMPDVMLLAYRHGFFPMADELTGRIEWHRPDPRAIIPVNGIRISQSTQKLVRRGTFSITYDTCFRTVMEHCANRPERWISDDLVDAYTHLHEQGFAHSVEAWQNNRLVGGLYGVHIGSAFMGESMFSLVSNASKVAFAHLALTLRANHFRLLDTQYINHHTASLGAVEIPDAVYAAMLASAVETWTDFAPDSAKATP
jgi:leucyl/phenylalanyl-tRNA--protein transferase